MTRKIEELKEITKEAPKSPGVYLMKNRLGKVIYVGKAKNIRNRVRSYFQKSKDLPPKTRVLVSYIQEMDFLTTNTEAEAFLLEASLIKKHKPKYNIRLKDDKAYPYLHISLSHDYPRLYLTRKVKGSPKEYFGPFTSSFAVRETIKFLNRTFRIRDCSDHDFKSRKRPCMTHQIGRCTAPCVGLVTKEEYAKDIDMALKFLRGQKKRIVKDLEKKMKAAAGEERFEEAARLRDSVNALEHILEKQNVVKSDISKNIDVLGFYGESDGVVIECVHVRSGIMIGHQNHFFSSANIVEGDEDIRDTLTNFIMQYYQENLIPEQVFTPVDLGKDLQDLTKQVLEERAHKEVEVRYPQDQAGKNLVVMAMNNAKESYKKHMQKVNEQELALQEVQKKLHLAKIPKRIECYDISHFQGDATVGSQVVFENGLPAKEYYRLYKIKTVKGIDDFASMKEVLSRRLKHEEYDDPDLIVVDGGKGQLKLAREALKECGRDDIPICSLAKARTERDFAKEEVKSSMERVFLPGRDNPVMFYPNSKSYQILTQVRDEAHRFAIQFHRRLRDKQLVTSSLDDITGLGPKRKAALLKAFGSVEAIAKADETELASLVSKSVAKNIKKYFGL